MKTFKEFLIEGPLPTSDAEAVRIAARNKAWDSEHHPDDDSYQSSAFSDFDDHGNPRGGFSTITHLARLINTRNGTHKSRRSVLTVHSNRSEKGDLEFNIITNNLFGEERKLHKYILPAGVTTLNYESSVGHVTEPGIKYALSINDVGRVLREHLLSTIKDEEGKTVMEAHGIDAS